MGSSTEHCAWGPVANPWDLHACRVAHRVVRRRPWQRSTCRSPSDPDTCGRSGTAALTGTVGLRPTCMVASRIIAFASSLDQVGPFARDVRDAALLLGAIAGHDPRDSTSAPVPVPHYAAALPISGTDVRR